MQGGETNNVPQAYMIVWGYIGISKEDPDCVTISEITVAVSIVSSDFTTG